MKITTKRNLYLVLIIIFSATLLISVYELLGGFDEVHVYQLTPVERTVIGRHFEEPDSKAALKHRELCRNLILKEELQGILTEVIFLSDTLENAEKGRFIGVSISNDISEVPSGFEVREYDSGLRYAVFLSMHALVRPRPPVIEGMIYAKAQEEGKELEDYFFTLIYQDNSISVEGWVK